VIDTPDPEPGQDDATIRFVSLALYGTDLGVYLNRGGRYPQSYSVGTGVDFSGIVDKVGVNVDGWLSGG
jgi:NADPH:quinone reductase-like Zn-dependent oxidoreductase